MAPRRPVRTVSGPSAVPARQAMRTSRPMLAAVTSMSVHTPPGTTGSGEALHNVIERILTQHQYLATTAAAMLNVSTSLVGQAPQPMCASAKMVMKTGGKITV